MTKPTSTAMAVLSLFAATQAWIVADGPWDTYDWHDSATGIGVTKGEPYCDNADMKRRIRAGTALLGDISDYRTYANVKRVLKVFPEDKFNYFFSERDDVYTYEGFLYAVGRFPAFCAESNLQEEGYDLDDTCRRELSTMFAHINQETGLHDDTRTDLDEYRQGLHYVTEMNCTPPSEAVGTEDCDYKEWGVDDEEYPNQSNVQYFGRGPLQLSWNYNYGAFSEVLYENEYLSRMHLLKEPDLVFAESTTAWFAALWFFMTPQTPKPSIHDLATGFFVPTQADEAAGITATFGTTTNIINGNQECNDYDERAQDRADYYIAFLDAFGLPPEDESEMTCDHQSPDFPEGGYGEANYYFDQNYNFDDDGERRCEPVNYQTPYSILTKDDYKRCVCEFYGDGESSCPQASLTMNQTC